MRPTRLLLVALLLAGVLLQDAGIAGEQPQGPPRKVRVEVPPDGSVLVRGEYPPTSSSCVDPVQPLLHERYRGAVEVVRDEGSLTLLGELPFEDYLKGIAEVPRSWPMEALKAQVVAARSYAATELDPGGAYDLCATDACQVYAGMRVERGAYGARWARAVEQTAGEVLLWGGEPARTFYFSTSNGRTYTNEDVWGTPRLPYLERTRERDDGESPVAHWRVEVPFDDLATLLRAAGRWPGGEIRRVRARNGTVVVRGGGERVRLAPGDLRTALNTTARCLMPDRYPTRRPDGSRLPQAVPSHWFEAEVEGRTLVLEGRGWGHGIGMVQWGAKGKADRGLSHGDILAAYYGGLRPRPHDLPRTIRVLLATGLRSVTIVPEGESTIRVRGREPPEPPLRVVPRKRGLRVRHAEPPEPELEVRRVEGALGPDDRLRVRFRSQTPVRARLELASGGDVHPTAWRDAEGGRVRFAIDLPDGLSGEVEVMARITDGVDTIAVPVTTVTAPADPSPAAAPATPGGVRAAPVRGEEPGGFPIAIAAAAVIALLAALVVLRARRARRLHPH